jgi:WD40-like Beta Propeller Repeat
MTDRLDTLLREVIHDLAAEGDLVRPEDRDRRRFALDATDRGYQHRNRRRAGLVGVVALVIAFAFGVPYGLDFLRDDRGYQPATTATGVTTTGPDGVPTQVHNDTNLPIALVDGWYVLGNKKVLDPATNTYTTFNGRSVLPSPNGRWVAFSPSSGDIGVFRVLDRSTGVSRRYEVDDVEMDPQWSPDGNVLLFTAPLGGSAIESRLVFLDVRTGTTTDTSVVHAGLNCIYCAFSWLPSGEEIALTHVISTNTLPVTNPATLRTYGLDGRPSRTLPVAGFPRGPGAWSPDGRLVVVVSLAEDGESRQAQIVEVATGSVRHRFSGYVLQAAWVDSDRVLTWSADFQADPIVASVTLITADGTPMQRWTVPPEIVKVESTITGGGPLAADLSK